MELIKICDEKSKIIISNSELKHYGICKEKSDNIESIYKVFSVFKKSFGVDFLANSISVKTNFYENGDCELTVRKISSDNEFQIKTFVFEKIGLNKAILALKNSNATKNSSLYKYNNIYIWEIFCKKSSVIPCRLADFGKEINLSSRRDFLSLLCERINF